MLTIKNLLTTNVVYMVLEDSTLYFLVVWSHEAVLYLVSLPLLLNQMEDYGKTPSGETEVQFRLTRVTLEPMLKSMAYISQQLSASANRVAVINLKVSTLKFLLGSAPYVFLY